MLEGGGNCLKYLTRGSNRKGGRGNKDFKKGGKLGQGVAALKKGGAGTSSQTMTYICVSVSIVTSRPVYVLFM